MKTNIELAREAGFSYYIDVALSVNGNMPQVDKLIELAEARLMAKLLEGAGEPTYFYVSEDAMWKESKNGTGEPFFDADQIAAAVLREREECAKACLQLETAIDGGGNAYYRPADARQCVAAIRNRGTK